LGIILILQNINLKVVEKKVYSWENLKRILLITVLGFLYIFWVRYIGFLFLTPFLILSLLYLFDYKELVKGILISIGVTLVLYVLFYSIFKVPLPTFSLF
jgi:bacteriorhodopsin